MQAEELTTKTKAFRIFVMVQTMAIRDSKAGRSAAARLLGRRSYCVRLERLGIERIRAIARANGRKGGRPPKVAEVRNESL